MITLHMEQGQCVDVLYMLTDYIQTMEDKLTFLGDPEDDSDKQYQEEEQALLATAIVLYDSIENGLETVKHGGG